MIMCLLLLRSGKKVPKLQKEVAIFDHDKVPDDPQIEYELFNKFLNYTKKKLKAPGTSSQKPTAPSPSSDGDVSYL